MRRIVVLSLILQLAAGQGFCQFAGPAEAGFRPLHLRAVAYDARQDGFGLVLDKGDSGARPAADVERDAAALMRYFLTGLRLPDSSFWVNLRPDSPQDMLDPRLASTDIGRIMLEADVQLKKDTAAYTSPRTKAGKEYWDKLYRKAEELYGGAAAAIPALARPWIMPDEIILRESGSSAYIYKATLKVVLEGDRLTGSDRFAFADERARALNEYSAQLMRELIVPRMNVAVNSSRAYAALRQVYYSLILAQWYKRVSAAGTEFDTGDLSGVASRTAWSAQDYFRQYQRSFREGEYTVRETARAGSRQTIRLYASGGIGFDSISGIVEGSRIAGVPGSMIYNPRYCLAGQFYRGNVRLGAAAMDGGRLDPGRIYNKDKSFMNAVAYFNEQVLPDGPMTWEQVAEIFRLVRGEAPDPQLSAVRARSLKAKEEKLMSMKQGRRRDGVLPLVNDTSFAGKPARDAALHAECIYYSIVAPVQFFVSLDGFRESPDELTRHPADGHHRVAWFLMNYFLIRNGYEPVYFSDKEDYAKAIHDRDFNAMQEVKFTDMIAGRLRPVPPAGPPADGGEKGGVDFRALASAARTAPGGVFAGVEVSRSALDGLDREMGQVRRMLDARIEPSAQRFRELAAACRAKQEWETRRTELFLCAEDILRLEEERARGTDGSLRDILTLLEQ